MRVDGPRGRFNAIIRNGLHDITRAKRTTRRMLHNNNICEWQFIRFVNRSRLMTHHWRHLCHTQLPWRSFRQRDHPRYPRALSAAAMRCTSIEILITNGLF